MNIKETLGTLGIGFLFGLWASVALLQFGAKPEIAQLVQQMQTLQSRGLSLQMDNRCRVWMWDERTKTSFDITQQMDDMVRAGK